MGGEREGKGHYKSYYFFVFNFQLTETCSSYFRIEGGEVPGPQAGGASQDSRCKIDHEQVT